MERRNFLKGLLATIAGLPIAANLKPREPELEAIAQEIELPSEPLPENHLPYGYGGTMVWHPLHQTKDFNGYHPAWRIPSDDD